MTNGCPGRAEWLSLLDGEATENRAVVLRAHAGECPACARELALQRQLLADLAATVPVAPGAVEAIMRQLPDAQPARSRRRPWLLGGGALVLAVAAGILLIPRVPKDDGTFVPRGGDVVPWSQKVGAEVFVLGDALVKLEAGARVSPGVALVASYHNVDRAPAYLMVFGRDVRGELHWVYPGFEDAKKDPESVRLLPLQARQVLPDGVALDELPAGELELVCLITREPLHVSQIESLPPAQRNSFDLRTRFVEARITSLSLQVVAPTPAPPPQARAQAKAPARSTPSAARAPRSRAPRATAVPGEWLQAVDPIPASVEGL
jgi:hypothetical protein